MAPKSLYIIFPLSKAEVLPGFKCVITGKDSHCGKLGNPEAFKELADKDPLCKGEVKFVGDEIASVAAVDDDAPSVHYPGTNNVSMFTTMQIGDTDRAFHEADYTDKHHCKTQMMVHAAIEPHGARIPTDPPPAPCVLRMPGSIFNRLEAFHEL